MTITYNVGAGLYINITNRCSNDCAFCIRLSADSVGGGDTLWLEREPSREEILNDIKSRNLADYGELVFCGYGEPTERLDDLLWLCGQLKQTDCPPIRLNTNGHASLIAGYDVAHRFAGLVDKINVSLNAADDFEYYELCRPAFGIESYRGMLDFAVKVRGFVPEVWFSVVNGTTDAEACRKVAEDLGLTLRVR